VSTRSTRARGGSSGLNDVPEGLFPNLQEDETRVDAPTESPMTIGKYKEPHVTAIQVVACGKS
jgi:hypothetical protein